MARACLAARTDFSSSERTDDSATKPSKASSSTSLPAKLAKNPRLPATMFPAPAPGQQFQSQPIDTSTTSGKGKTKLVSTPVAVAKSKKKSSAQESRKQRLRVEAGREKAVEREAALQERVKGREERKVSGLRCIVPSAECRGCGSGGSSELIGLGEAK